MGGLAARAPSKAISMLLQAVDAATIAATGNITPDARRKTIIGRLPPFLEDVQRIPVQGDYLAVDVIHCSVDKTGPDCWTVTDLRSKNGTRLDLVKLQAGRPARLRNGNVLQLGVHLERSKKVDELDRQRAEADERPVERSCLS